MMIDRGPFVSLSEAAELLGCTIKDTKELIRGGQLSVKRIGQTHIIPREDIMAYLARENPPDYVITPSEK